MNLDTLELFLTIMINENYPVVLQGCQQSLEHSVLRSGWSPFKIYETNVWETLSYIFKKTPKYELAK